MRPFAVFTCLVLLAASSKSDSLQALDETAQSYYNDVVAIAPITGRDTALDYYQRLIQDQDLVQTPAPSDYTESIWRYSVANIVRLDVDLANQLMGRAFRPMASIRGLEETFVRSSKDGTMQPVAVYVPENYDPAKPAPLVVFLHGRPQSESQLLAPQFIAGLAEMTGTIIVAPYGRAYYDFVGSESDVYDAYDAALKAFHVDPRKRYLVGYSMGGFSVFGVAPVHPEDWSAVMCIAGSLLGSRAHRVVALMTRTPFYVLTGSADDSIPTQYPTTTAVFLRDAGLPVTFYQEPGGKHRLLTLLPILKQAWDDMHHGVVRTPFELSSGWALPAAPPGNPLKP